MLKRRWRFCAPSWLRRRKPHERRFTGFDDKIIAMVARGMTVRDIREFLLEQYGTHVSPKFVSSVTDEVMAEVTVW